MAEDLADLSNIEAAWRPLTPTAATRAEYLLGLASRKIRRQWRDVDTRIASGALEQVDVVDVVVGLVLQALPLAPHPGARTWQVSSGAESRSITLGAASGDPNRMELTDWMLDILDPAAAGAGGALPAFSAPPAANWPDPARPAGPPVVTYWQG